MINERTRKRHNRIQRLRHRDGDRCQICNHPIDFKRKKVNVTIDHIIPQYYGTCNRLYNLRLTHKKCNRRRGHELLPSNVVIDYLDKTIQMEQSYASC